MPPGPEAPRPSGLRELSGLAALGLCVAGAVALALSTDGGPRYAEHLRAVLSIQILVAVEVAVAAVWLWLTYTAQQGRLLAALAQAQELREDRAVLAQTARDLARATGDLIGALRVQREVADGLRAVAELYGVDVVAVGRGPGRSTGGDDGAGN